MQQRVYIPLDIHTPDDMKARHKLHLAEPPDDVMLPVYLIREELKSRRLFHALHEIGIGDCYFQPHLDSLILRSMGMDDRCDQTFDVYFQIIDKRSRKITMDSHSVIRQAFKVYDELLHAKKKLLRKRKTATDPSGDITGVGSRKLRKQ